MMNLKMEILSHSVASPEVAYICDNSITEYKGFVQDVIYTIFTKAFQVNPTIVYRSPRTFLCHMKLQDIVTISPMKA